MVEFLSSVKKLLRDLNAVAILLSGLTGGISSSSSCSHSSSLGSPKVWQSAVSYGKKINLYKCNYL